MSPRSDPRAARAEASSAPTLVGAGDGPSPPGEEGGAPAGAAAAPALSREEIDRLLLARADRAIFGQPGEPAAALPTTLFTPPPAAPPPRPRDRRATAGDADGDGGEDAAGPLEVTIGRLEVVAPPPPPEPRPRHRPTPHTSLDDYLQGRRVGG